MTTHPLAETLPLPVMYPGIAGAGRDFRFGAIRSSPFRYNQHAVQYN
jgi:hypothetical protein